MLSMGKRGKRAEFVFVLLAAVFGLALFQPDKAICFICNNEPDSSALCRNYPYSLGSLPGLSDDTVKAVAIYACGSNAPTDTLPDWWASVWNADAQHSVPRFYKENSFGKHIIEATPLGRDAGHCFKAPIAFPSSISEQFFDSIIYLADVVYNVNFANFDRNHDDTVDVLFFVVVNHSADDMGLAQGAWPGYSYVTRDTSVNLRPIIIHSRRCVLAKSPGEANTVSVCSHEWGHALGLPDLYVPGRGLGAYSIMAGTFFEHRAVPFDPWSRWKLGWVTPIEVTSPLYQDSISDYLTTGSVYKLSKDGRQYFLVTNHKGIDPVNGGHFWERLLPGRGGLLIWHVDTARCSNLYEKVIDLENAYGLWNWDLTACTTTTANRFYGKDSMDLGCTFLSPSPAGNAKSWWNFQTKTAFDGSSNPSSDAYRDTFINGVRTQDIPTCLAVRNIGAGNFSTAFADFIINNKSGQVSQNTTWSQCVAMTGDVTVNAGVTLTVSPGTFIVIESGKRLIIKGTLTCLATVTDSIIFTSASSSPARGAG